MAEDRTPIFEPHLASREVSGNAIWYVRIKTGAGEFITLSDETACKPVAAREMRRIRQEMAEQWLDRNVTRFKKHNDPKGISKGDDFLQFQMELYDYYKPLTELPVLEPYIESMKDEDRKTWKKNMDVFIAAYIATKHPSWTVLSVAPRSGIFHNREVIVEKDSEKRRILFWATENAFHHQADSRAID